MWLILRDYVSDPLLVGLDPSELALDLIVGGVHGVAVVW